VRFEVTQRFDADPAAVMACYSSTEMYGKLPEFGRISRPDVVDRTERGDTVTLKLHYAFVADLPAAAIAVIDPKHLTWIEETTYDLAALTARTRLIPDHYGSKFEASAHARFVDAAHGSTRNVSGDLKVHVLLVGGKVERVIVDGLKEHLDEEAKLVARLL
jgi:hypothetical protein